MIAVNRVIGFINPVLLTCVVALFVALVARQTSNAQGVADRLLQHSESIVLLSTRQERVLKDLEEMSSTLRSNARGLDRLERLLLKHDNKAFE